MKLFSGSTDIIDNQIEEMFSKPKETEMDIVLKTVSLLLYENCNNTDLVELYRLLGIENFSKVLMLFDGRQIQFPKKDQFVNTLISALVYYYREVEGLSWEQTKEKFPFEISGISHGIQVKKLNNFIRQKLDENLRRIK